MPARTLANRLSALISPPKNRRAVAPALLVLTGAGAALLWWTQWARGRAESEPAVAEAPLADDAWTGPEG